MFQTMTQIAKNYELEAKDVGNILYDLKIRDANHPVQKGFPFEQSITHGIAQATTARSGETYYRYDITSLQEEFVKRVTALKEKQEKLLPKNTTHTLPQTSPATIEHKLQEMLQTLNLVLASGEMEKLYHLKADIADIYALLKR